jgi:hypothetical protein
MDYGWILLVVVFNILKQNDSTAQEAMPQTMTKTTLDLLVASVLRVLHTEEFALCN